MGPISDLPASGVRLLVVDDDSGMRVMLADHLHTLGLAVSSARSGQDAVELLNSEAFDIVLTDLVMPGVDGMAVLEAARQSDPRTHVVVMTGYSSLKTAINSVRSGAFDYLTKPFELVQIEIIVNRILENRRLKAENVELNRRVALLTEQNRSVDTRLGAIESQLSSLVAKLDRRDKSLTELDF